MKSLSEAKILLSSTTKEKEEALGIKIRNGQAIEAIRKTIAWIYE